MRIFGRNRHKSPAERDVLRLPLPPAGRAVRHYLVGSAIIGDEMRYIREWVAFHYVVGFDKLALYLNRIDCYEATLRELRDFVDVGFVTLTPWPDFLDVAGRSPVVIQNHANAHAIALARSHTRWLALIDVDEFLFSPTYDQVPDALQTLEAFPAVAVFWRNFGSGGRMSKSDGLVAESYFQAAADNCLLNRKYKSIVDPCRITGVFNAHRFLTDQRDVVAYTESGSPLGNWHYKHNKHESQLLRINHYHVKSDAEFKERLVTGWAAKHPPVAKTRERERAEIEAATIADHSIERFVQRTKEVISRGPIERNAQTRLNGDNAASPSAA